MKFVSEYGVCIDEDMGYSYTFPTLGLGFWRPNVFMYEMIDNPEFKEMDEEIQIDETKYLYFEVICIFVDNYYK